MIFHIRDLDGRYSCGHLKTGSVWVDAEKKKVWNSLSAFAGHLALFTHKHQKLEKEPTSLFAIYGKSISIVVESWETPSGWCYKETPFDIWYSNYYATSEKFRAIRKTNAVLTANYAKEVAKNTVHFKPMPTTQVQLELEPARTGASWDVQTKTAVTRAFNLAEKFVPNLKFEELRNHPKNGETFAKITISGEQFALLKL